MGGNQSVPIPVNEALDKNSFLLSTSEGSHGRHSYTTVIGLDADGDIVRHSYHLYT